MAGFGAKHPCFKGEKDENGVIIGKLVAANLTIQMANGELYADDQLAEQVSEFASGTCAMETDDMVDEVAGKVYGCKVTGGVVSYNIGDAAPMGKLGYYKVLKRSGVKFYKGYYYPRVQAALGNDNAQTRGSNITFQTSTTSFTVYADENGDWRKTKTCSTEAEVKEWLNELLSISATGSSGASGSSPTDVTLKIGSDEIALTHDTLTYTAATTNATNKVTAEGSGEITLTLNGQPLESGATATWNEGENTVTVTVDCPSCESEVVYTVTVTKS